MISESQVDKSLSEKLVDRYDMKKMLMSIPIQLSVDPYVHTYMNTQIHKQLNTHKYSHMHTHIHKPVFLIRSYDAPNGSGGCFWPSRVIRIGPHRRSSKIIWVNIVHAVLDVGT